MKTILFNTVTFNLSETTHAINIARAISEDFHCHFASYGGEFEPLVGKEDFPHTRLEPHFTPQTVQRIYAFDQGRRIGEMHNVETVRKMVRAELQLLKSMQPAAVVTGMDPSSCLACQVADIPLVWFIQSGKVLNASAHLGNLKNMDMLDVVPIRWLPGGFRIWLSEMLLKFSFPLISRSFNQVAAEYGLKPYGSYDEVVFRSKYQVVAEPQGFSNLSFPPSAHFIGPQIARLNVSLPEEVLNMPRDLPIVYFAMGSSGRPHIIARIIESFAGKPYRVIAPVSDLLDLSSVRVPENVLVTGWLPALEANRLADMAVIHGGIGTIMNACLAGKPVVGVAMSPEQYINLESLVQKGFAHRIPRGKLNAERLCEAIDRMLNNPQAQEKARAYQKVAQEWDSPEYTRRFFCEKFGEGAALAEPLPVPRDKEFA